jgi:hypothetical protein
MPPAENILDLESLERASRSVLNAHDRGEDVTEPLAHLYKQINGTAILYGAIIPYLAKLEAESLQKSGLCRLLIPVSFQGEWYYVPRNGRQIESTETIECNDPNY